MIFRSQASRVPSRSGLVWQDRVRTYAELALEVERVAAALTGEGVAPGDRVLIALGNRPEFLVIQQAAEAVGALAVTVSPHLRPAELGAIVGDAQPVVMIAEPSAVAALEAVGVGRAPYDAIRTFVTDGGMGRFEAFESWLSAAASSAPRAVEAKPGATILYTSGTSGLPKAAIRAPSTASAAAMLRFVAQTPMAKGRGRASGGSAAGQLSVSGLCEDETADRHLIVMPLYHATAQAFANINFLLGNTVVLVDGFEPSAFLSAVERHRIAHAAVVPTMLFRLVELDLDVFRGYDTRSLRALFSISAPLSARLVDATMRRFGSILYNVYGATELGLVAMAAPEDLQVRPGTIGRPIPGVRIRLLDENGVDVPSGVAGELYARSPSRMTGYRGSARARETHDGFLSVGDLARCDETGLFECVGRVSDVIITGGINVRPAEVEAVLEAHPGVGQAAVVGVPDDEWGERVVAVVAMREGWDAERLEAELIGHCRECLDGPKRPREFRFVAALPVSAVGKVERRALRRP